MIAVRCGILLGIAPAALLLAAAPVEAKHGKQTVEAGPIWNDIDAKMKCPRAASAAGAKWTGQWWTTVPGQMSVCQITRDAGWNSGGGGSGGGGKSKNTVDAGPIWNDIDAKMKCPRAASSVGAAWTGQWWTTVPGRMSVCEIKR